MFAVVGAGLVMSNLWRDKVIIDTVLAAAVVLDEDALRALVELLVHRMANLGAQLPRAASTSAPPRKTVA